MTTDRTYRIGEVATAAGVTPEALRYYEREGLLPSPLRSARGARRYGADVLDRVGFIKEAQAAGLTLRDIHILVQVRGASRRDCQKIRRVLAARVADLDRRLAQIQAFRDVLGAHLEACDRALITDTSECPAIDALEGRAVKEQRS
jgi:MerR family copper efflux transcriptional regulator